MATHDPAPDPIEQLVTGVDQYLSALSDEDFDAVVARTREPRTGDNADETSAARSTARKLFGK